MYRIVFIRKSNGEIFITIEYIFPFFIVLFDLTIAQFILFKVFVRFLMFLCISAIIRRHSIGSNTSWKCILTIPMFVESEHKYQCIWPYSSDCARIPMPCYLIHLRQLSRSGQYRRNTTAVVVYYISMHFTHSVKWMFGTLSHCICRKAFIYGLHSFFFARSLFPLTRVYLQRLFLLHLSTYQF